MRLLVILAACVTAFSVDPTSTTAEEIGPWRQIENMPQRRWEPGTVVLGDKLYLFGGYDNRPEPGPLTIDYVDYFDAKDRTWHKLRELPSAITHFNPVLIL